GWYCRHQLGHLPLLPTDNSCKWGVRHNGQRPGVFAPSLRYRHSGENRNPFWFLCIIKKDGSRINAPLNLGILPPALSGMTT
ncbi:MAG: hypothetical protein ACRD5Z_03540, partial [Bryobacteraceae bacterium]